ncbi:MAG: hypothetical protein ACI822_001719 [Gammaproteobacteria bacterium]|jgi:hypothetical protein
MTTHHLAQLNIAKMKFPIDSPDMSGFVDQLDEVNALADAAPGFVWRLQTEEGDATGIDFFGSDILVNMSVWEDVESLHNYVYRSAHNKVMAQRKQWFDSFEQLYSVLWWVEAGHVPDLEEASARLQLLREQGATQEAFTFKQLFEAQ